MFKRLNYENESDYDTETEIGIKQRKNSRMMNQLQKNERLNMSMDSLFPNLQFKNRCAGSIVKNIQ
jgi:hypothetical protein